ncbi:hypothetical protein [Verrucosispora sioxanthis]|uniref:hypothetical protein n=1 Tax=Verrucosispora sioxanthis TaxID=2499994 RepID=UPI001C0F50F3|nr:hypothetical protein [Verrucosispora sioxanthis]
MTRSAESTVRRRRELAAGGTSDLFALVSSGDADGVAAALEGLPEQRRREIGVELTAWFKQRDRDTWWSAGTGPPPPRPRRSSVVPRSTRTVAARPS